jgi:hypothetical protein
MILTKENLAELTARVVSTVKLDVRPDITNEWVLNRLRGNGDIVYVLLHKRLTCFNSVQFLILGSEGSLLDDKITMFNATLNPLLILKEGESNEK